MTTTTPELEQPTDRAFVTAYTAVVIDDAAVVLDESFDTASARRDAVVELLLANHDEVDSDIVDEVLAPYGGANADAALAEIVVLYAEYGVDVHLGTYQRDVGPAVLYTAFTIAEDGATLVEHFATREDRLKELRRRAAFLGEGQPYEYYDNADESRCQLVIEYAIAPTGRLFLVQAERAAAGETYFGYAPKETR